MSRWRRLEIDALIDASGVRRSCETACSRAARNVLAAARSAARTASTCRRSRSLAAASWASEGVEQPLVVARELTAGESERHAAPEVPADVGVRRARWRDRARRHEHVPAAARLVEQRGGTEPERRAQLAEHVADRPGAGQRAGQRGKRLGLRLQTGGAHPAAPDPVDEHGDDPGRDGVDDEGEGVVAVGDRQPVERRREVPVGEQEAADHGDAGREHAADEGDDHRQHEVQQQDARQARPGRAGWRR